MTAGSSALPTSEEKSSSPKQELLKLFGAPEGALDNMLLNLYGKQDSLNKTKDLADIEGKLDVILKQAYEALKYRKEHCGEAKSAMDGISVLAEDKSTRPVVQELADKMKGLQGQFIAEFSACKENAVYNYIAVYHFYGHGIEMIEDSPNFLKNSWEPSEDPKTIAMNSLWEATAGSLAAAHDVLQGEKPPINEEKSAKVFEHDTREMIAKLIKSPDIQDHQKADAIKTALQNFSEHAIPFLAREGIINATYLLFTVGKRDFANLLTQIQSTLSPGTTFEDSFKLDRPIAAIQTAIAISDTRRSEMPSVLKKQEILNAFRKEKERKALEKLLRGIKLLDEEETIASLQEKIEKIPEEKKDESKEKLYKIEGFLLRLGQNVRMTTEISKDPKRRQLIKSLRRDRHPAVSVTDHLDPFLDTINEGAFGEITFARGIGDLNVKKEVKEQAEKSGLSRMVNAETLIPTGGWGEHATHLAAMKAYINNPPPELSEDEKLELKQEMTKLLYVIAAKSPGRRVTDEILNTMRDTLQEMKTALGKLEQKDPQAGLLLKKYQNLSEDIYEIEVVRLNEVTEELLEEQRTELNALMNDKEALIAQLEEQRKQGNQDEGAETIKVLERSLSAVREEIHEARRALEKLLSDKVAALSSELDEPTANKTEIETLKKELSDEIDKIELDILSEILLENLESAYQGVVRATLSTVTSDPFREACNKALLTSTTPAQFVSIKNKIYQELLDIVLKTREQLTPPAESENQKIVVETKHDAVSRKMSSSQFYHPPVVNDNKPADDASRKDSPDQELPKINP